MFFPDLVLTTIYIAMKVETFCENELLDFVVPFFFEIGFHSLAHDVDQVGLNFQRSSCFCLSAGIKGGYHHTQSECLSFLLA